MSSLAAFLTSLSEVDAPDGVHLHQLAAVVLVHRELGRLREVQRQQHGRVLGRGQQHVGERPHGVGADDVAVERVPRDPQVAVVVRHVEVVAEEVDEHLVELRLAPGLQAERHPSQLVHRVPAVLVALGRHRGAQVERRQRQQRPLGGDDRVARVALVLAAGGELRGVPGVGPALGQCGAGGGGRPEGAAREQVVDGVPDERGGRGAGGVRLGQRHGGPDADGHGRDLSTSGPRS